MLMINMVEEFIGNIISYNTETILQPAKLR